LGVAPDRLAKQLSDNGQLPSVAADVLRGNALTWLAEQATVIDEAGRAVDIRAASQAGATDAEDAGDADGDEADTESGADEE
jgi:trigger factor